ncbi:MAG TPA: hypothetical protein VLT62_11840 [Candidatus Methylomirabilis sp.]|nr:hypothetical protein [Candidatus Methylomirabilis sp.]
MCLLVGCATGRIVDGTYRDPALGYEVRLPPSPWVLAPLDGAVLSFKAPALRAAMALDVECRNPEPGELPWVARHLFFGLRDERPQEREVIHVSGAEAIRSRLLATLDGVPVEVEGVTARRGGCLYDFMYAAPPTEFSRGRPDFLTFVNSWIPLTTE